MAKNAVLAVMIAALTVGFGLQVAADVTPGGQSKLKAPAAVLEAFQKDYPKATISAVSKETVAGSILYEIEAVEGDRERGILYTADGRLIQVGEEISPTDLPEAVRKAVAADFPNSELEEADRITRGDETFFEVAIEAGERERELLYSSSGVQVVEDSDDDGDDHEDDDEDHEEEDD